MCIVSAHSSFETSVLVRFAEERYNVTEGTDDYVVITVEANGAVDESSFSVNVDVESGSAGSGYTLFTYTVI